jgi:hypothetical protein
MTKVDHAVRADIAMKSGRSGPVSEPRLRQMGLAGSARFSPARHRPVLPGRGPLAPPSLPVLEAAGPAVSAVERLRDTASGRDDWKVTDMRRRARHLRIKGPAAVTKTQLIKALSAS